MTLSANMLVGPLDEPYICGALESIKWVDEIVIIDNNASNLNIKLLDSWIPSYKGNLVFVHYYNHYDDFNFTSARNLGIKNSSSDYILKIDADELYYDSFEETFKSLDYQVDMYKVSFYHLFYDVHHYRMIEPKEVIFRRSSDIYWTSPVHEQLYGVNIFQQLDDKFVHFGYIKPNIEVLKKWILYATLEGEPNRYDGSDVNTILDGVDVFDFNLPFPEAAYRLNWFEKTT